MQKINSLTQYTCVPEGQSVKFRTDAWRQHEPRQIRLAINAPQEVRLYAKRDFDVEALHPHTGEKMYLSPEVDPETGEVIDDIRFVARVIAFDQIEFYYPGDFDLFAIGGEFWMDGVDGTIVAVQATDYESYARVMEREEEDPRILEMKALARYNQELLNQQMARDRAELIAMREQLNAMREANVVPNANPAKPAGEVAAAGGSAVGVQSGDGSNASASSGAGADPAAVGTSDEGAA